MDEARSQTTITSIIKEEKAQLKDEEKANQDQGTINPKYNTTIVKRM